MLFIPANRKLSLEYEKFIPEGRADSKALCGTEHTIHVPMALACVMVERLRRFHNGTLNTTSDFWAIENFGSKEYNVRRL